MEEREIWIKRRADIIGLLEKWIRAFEDDILAEHSAIDLYTSHRKEFSDDFGLGTMGLTARIFEDLGFSKRSAQAKEKILESILEPQKFRDIPSIDHIIMEEREHAIEFREMKGVLVELKAKLENLKNPF